MSIENITYADNRRMSGKTSLLLVAGLLVLTTNTAMAGGTCSAKSGDTSISLLELYTSEGCSSCPPADQWLATLRTNGLYPGKVVPLALHVDYWNDLGWEDPYSQKIFTQRQYQTARRTSSRTVYTPQFLLNGQEFLRWRQKGKVAIERASSVRPRADISLTLSRHANEMEITTDVRTDPRGGRAEFYIVLFENNLTTRVPAGENQGETLRHDFVARRWLGPIPLSVKDATSFTHRLSLDKTWKADDMGVAAFVQDRETGEVWQALARPFCS
jgi:hypothetical protein